MSLTKGFGVGVGVWSILTGCVLGLTSPCSAGGLKCSIGEVVIENLSIGQTHSLEELAALLLTITNTGELPVTVKVEPTIPEGSDLRYGASAIPDLSWASVDRETFVLAPNESERVNMSIRIPDERQLLGQKYQVNFWSHTLPQPGDFVACGLSSRVVFSINPARAEEGASLAGGTSIALSPSEVTLRTVTAGEPLSLETSLDQPLVLENPSSERVTVELSVLHLKATGAQLQAGFGDLLEVARVDLSPRQVELGPGERKIVSGTVTFTPGRSFPEKTVIGIISAQVVGRNVTTGIFARIYAAAP